MNKRRFKIEHEYGKPFARAAAMFAAIAAAHKLLAHTPLLFRDACDKLGTYYSRGKGKHRSKPGRNYRKPISGHTPHYGDKQRAKDMARWEKQTGVCHE